jgi:hypothetical protein
MATTYGTYGQKAATGTAAALASTVVVYAGTVIKALAANDGAVYVGLTSAVTSGTGWELSAGNEMFVSKRECDDPASIYVIAASGTQTVCYRAV